jgi:serine/threonine protein kinase
LGAVFVALDSELHREVALKQILDHHADDPVSRSRFLLEAKITGGLEHPGIVPVYGRGTVGDGRPFYATHDAQTTHRRRTHRRRTDTHGLNRCDCMRVARKVARKVGVFDQLLINCPTR